MRWRFRAAGLLGLFLGSCGSADGLDIREVVERQNDFSAPAVLNTTLQPDTSNGGGTCVVTRLVRDGKLVFSPNTAVAPYYTASLTTGVMNGSRMSIHMGQRRVTDVSDQRNWKEGSTRYRAATVSYVIVDDGALGDADDEYGPFSLRVVFENNPAVGEWRLSSQTPRGITAALEQSTVARAVGSGSDCGSNAVADAIARAREEAFDAIEETLASNRGIAKSADRGLIESRRTNRVLYVGLRDEPSLQGVGMREMVPRARALCEALVVGGRSSWRLGTFAEMRSVTDTQRHDYLRLPVDTPDNRIWGAFFSSLPETGLYQLPVADPSFRDWGPYSALNVSTRGGRRFAEDADVHEYEMRNRHFRLFCSHAL